MNNLLPVKFVNKNIDEYSLGIKLDLESIFLLVPLKFKEYYPEIKDEINSDEFLKILISETDITKFGVEKVQYWLAIGLVVEFLRNHVTEDTYNKCFPEKRAMGANAPIIK